MFEIAFLAFVLGSWALLRLERFVLQRRPREFSPFAWIPAPKRVVALPFSTAAELARRSEIVTYRDRPGSDVDLERVRAIRRWMTDRARGEFEGDLSRGWIVERAPGDASVLLARFRIRVFDDRVEVRTRFFSNGFYMRAPWHLFTMIGAVIAPSTLGMFVVGVAIEAISALVNYALQERRLKTVLDRIVADLAAGGTFRETAAASGGRTTG